MSIEARAPAKLVLMGEYAVLHGAPAIVAAVDRLVHVELVPVDARGVWTVHSDLDGGRVATLTFAPGEEPPAWARAVRTVIARAAAAVGRAPTALPGGHLTIESGSLHLDAGGPKLGLGSSAAVVTALAAALRAMLAERGLEATGEDPLVADFRTHRLIQGERGSGVDVAASHGGGVLAYELVDGEPRATPLALPPDVVFRAVWTGAPASTPAFVERVRAFGEEEPEAHRQAIADLASLARRAVAACRDRDAPTFLALVDAYREAMDALGRAVDLPIVSPAHRDLAVLAAGAGAAYKPSGAGGGDVGLLFASSPETLLQAGRKAEAAGYGLVDLGIHPEGVRVTRPERSEP